MREAAKNGNASPANLAYLEDRVALRKEKNKFMAVRVRRIKRPIKFA